MKRVAARRSLFPKKGLHDGSPFRQIMNVCAYASARRRIMPKPSMESSAIAMRVMVEGQETTSVTLIQSSVTPPLPRSANGSSKIVLMPESATKEIESSVRFGVTGPVIATA